MRLAVVVLLGSILGAGFPGAAQAKFVTGLDLHRACSVRQGQPTFITQYTACLRYITGVADAIDEARVRQGRRACVPDGMRDYETRRVVADYVARHPESWHLPAATLIEEALTRSLAHCA